MQSTVTKEEAEAYLKEVDVVRILEQALEAGVKAKTREPTKFFASYFTVFQKKMAEAPLKQVRCYCGCPLWDGYHTGAVTTCYRVVTNLGPRAAPVGYRV